MEKKTVKKPKAKKGPKVITAEAVKETLSSMSAALKEEKVPEAKTVAKEAAKTVNDGPAVTLWVKRVVKEGEVESTWRIRGNFPSKKDAQDAFDKLNASGMYESRID